MDAFTKLYEDITVRKAKPEDFEPYAGGNGRIDRAVDLILNENFPRSGTLVDVGGATGNLGYALRDHFSERYTVDIAESCRLPAEKKGNIFVRANTDQDGLPFPDESSDGPIVDLIVALDFIEHILDPQKFADECLRILKPGGMVLINTPNIQFWRHLESLVCHGVFPHTSGDKEVYHGGHVAFYNFHDMDVIFRKFDNHCVHTRGLTPDPCPPIWSQLSAGRMTNIDRSYADLIFSCKKS